MSAEVLPAAGDDDQQPSRLGFVAWSSVAGRSAEIADSLGGWSLCLWHPRLTTGWRVPVRYAVSAVEQAVALARRRPRVVVATNPPIFPALVAWAYCTLTGGRLVLDSHPAGFGLKDNRVAKRMSALHRWLARRAVATFVTVEALADEVRLWGGNAIVVHEAVPRWRVRPCPAIEGRPQVLYIGRFANDEPTIEVLEAARAVPEVDVLVTGDPARFNAPPGFVLPPNVELVGFLPQDEYVGLLDRAHVVVTLTTEPTSVMRSAYEAGYAERPLVVTDTPALRETFPYAVHVQNSPDGIADGIRAVVRDHERLRRCTEAARQDLVRRWERQRQQIIDALA